jgi:hypothetical protein
MGNAYKIFARKSEIKRPVGRPRRRWEDDINTNLKQNVCGPTNGAGYGPVTASCEHGNQPSGSIRGEKFLQHSMKCGRKN